MYHSFLIHSSADGHLGCFRVLAIINSAVMNIGVHVSVPLLGIHTEETRIERDTCTSAFIFVHQWFGKENVLTCKGYTEGKQVSFMLLPGTVLCLG